MISIKKLLRYSPVILINFFVIYLLAIEFHDKYLTIQELHQARVQLIYDLIIKKYSLNSAVKINRLNEKLQKYKLRIVMVSQNGKKFGMPAYSYLQNKKIVQNPYKSIFWIKQKNAVYFIEDLDYMVKRKKIITSFIIQLLLIEFIINFFIINLILSLNAFKKKKKFVFDLFGLNFFLKDTYARLLKENEVLAKKSRILEKELEEFKIKEIRQKRDFDIVAFNKNIEYRLQRSEPTESLYATIMEGFCEYLGVLEVALYLPTSTEEYNLIFKYNYYGEEAFFPDKLFYSKLDFSSADYFIHENGLYLLLKANNDIPVGILYARDKLDSSEFDVDDVLLASNLTPKFITVIEKINSVTDGLTKLYNNRYFQQQIDKLFNTIKNSKRESDTFSLIMVDIDHFKKFNDKYGHQVGDFVLQNIAQIIKTSLREDDRAFRYGGEEMSILLPYTNEENGYIVAERLRKKVESTEFQCPLAKEPLKVTISLGVAEYNAKMKNYNELIRNADTALYRAKAGFPEKNIPGRNLTVRYSDITG